MDLLFTRYASPFLFMDEMIRNGQFCMFIHNVIKAKHESDEWEIYLHKVWDKSFSEFKEEIRLNQRHQNMTNDQIERIVNDSMNVLSNFNPEKE